MNFEKLFDVGAGLVKDRTAWFGSISSGVTAWWTNLSFTLPTSIAEWSATLLSVVSIVYVVFKIIRLWRNPKREE